MKPFFKPHNFITAMTTDEYVPDHVADIANAKLQNLIEASPKAYGNSTQFDIVSKPTSSDTHSAVIMFIEEIPKKDCAHEPSWGVHLSFRENIATCKHCGIELKAKWEPVK